MNAGPEFARDDNFQWRRCVREAGGVPRKSVRSNERRPSAGARRHAHLLMERAPVDGHLIGPI